MLRELWLDWVADNPFLHLDLRRWRKRGLLWKVPLACTLIPILSLLALNLLYVWLGPHRRGFLDRPFGAFLFSVVSLIHVLCFAGATSSNFSLNGEATADRLEFVRLLPMARRELLGRMGLARAVLRLVPALVGLPVYVLCMAFGGVNAEDVIGLYGLLLAFLFAPPGFAEVQLAMTARRGATTAATRKQQQANNPWFFGYIAFQLLFQLGLRPVVVPVVKVVWSRLAHVLGPQLGEILPLSAILAAARFFSQPQPFYLWMVAPAIPFGIYWILRTAGRLVSVAEIWSREPVTINLAPGRTQFALPLNSGREDERRTARYLHAAFASVFLLAVAGYLWRSMMQNGAMGALAGVPTAAGSVAALLLLAGGLVWIPLMERLRMEMRLSETLRTPSAYYVQAGLVGVARAAAVVAVAALLGGVSLWPGWAAALGMLIPCAASGLLFGLGWRAAGYRIFGGGQENARARSGAELLGLLLWVATYLGPLLLARYPRDEVALHLAAAWSPVYAYLRLLPGFWVAPPPAVFPIGFALVFSTVISAAALLWGNRGHVIERAAAAPRERQDPLERWLREVLAPVDNPFLNLGAYRLHRRPLGLMVQAAGGAVTAILLSAAIMWGIYSLAATSRRVPPWEALHRATPVANLSLGSVIGLALGGGFLATMGWTFLVAVPATVAQENAAARKQQRMHTLLISGVEDAQIVQGFVGAACLDWIGTAVATVLGSLIWFGYALVFGASPVWLVAWAAGVAAALAGPLACTFVNFERWRRWRGFRGWVARELRAAWPALLSVGGVVVPLTVWVVVSAPAGDVMATVPWVLLVQGVVLSAIVPLSYRQGVAAVRACRREDDLERAK